MAAINKEQELNVQKGLQRMGKVYDLDEVRVGCCCLIRKWEFCPMINGMVWGKVIPELTKREEGRKG